MQNSSHNNKIYSFLLFLVWPFLALCVSLKNFRRPEAKNMAWLFIAFYGLTFVISEDGMDANRYRDMFEENVRMDYSFEQFAATLYSQETQKVDIFEAFLNYFVSKFTSDFNVFLLVVGLIFGYFYSRNLWYVLDRLDGRFKTVTIPLIFAFALINPIWNINGFRFWTATHIFFFGVMPYLFEGNRKKLWLSVLTVFVHFSYMFPVLLLLIYVLLGNRRHAYFVFFMLTLFISEINIEWLNETIKSYMPEAFHSRADGYANVEKAEGLNEINVKRNWYAEIYGVIFRWTVMAFIILIHFRGQRFLENNREYAKLFGFTLFFYAMANIAGLVPSGGRFISLANLFALAMIVLYVQNSPRERVLPKLVPWVIPALALYCIVTIRIGFDTIGLFTVVGNVFTVPFMEDGRALIEFIK